MQENSTITAPKKIKKYNIFAAHRFITANPKIALFYAVVMIGSAIASVQGWFRWDNAFARWSFAVLMILVAIYFALCAWKSLQSKK